MTHVGTLWVVQDKRPVSNAERREAVSRELLRNGSALRLTPGQVKAIVGGTGTKGAARRPNRRAS